MLELTFHQTRAEFIVRVAATVLFNALQRSGCRMLPLSELVEKPKYGFTASASDEEVGPKFVRITDLQDQKINWSTVPYCECPEPAKYLLAPNDLLFARTGATTGKTYIVEEAPEAVFASYLIRVRPKSGVEPGYLFSFFQSDAYWAQIAAEKEGSAQPNVNARKLLGLRVPFADEEIQAAIAGFLKIVRARQDGEIEPLPELPSPLIEQHRIIAKIERLADRIERAQSERERTRVETDVLFESEVGSIFAHINTRNCRPLGMMATKIGSGSTPKGGRSVYVESGVPFIRSQNVRMRRFQWDDIVYIDTSTHERMSGTAVQPRDVLLNITGASIGRAACAPDDLETANVNQHVAIIRPACELLPRFVMYWLSQPSVQTLINDEQKGATRQGFTKRQIEAFEVPVLPLKEQQYIIDHLDDLQTKVNSLKQLQAKTATELDALLPSILDKAFKGEL